MTTVATEALKEPVLVSGLPALGSALNMAKDPGKFFYECYRKYGPVFRLKIMSNTYTVLAGTEAATFMGTREGSDSLRSKEFWQGMADEWGARRTLIGEDGETHQKLRAVMKHGYSKESVKGRYGEFLKITDAVIDRDWPNRKLVSVVQNMQYIASEQLGAMLTGTSQSEYVKDIRTTVLYMLNILVTRQWPKFLLKDPRYKRAKERVSELGRRMIAEYNAGKAQRDPARRNLVDEVMEAHERDPDLIPASDLVMYLTGPFVAGLDTVANTTAAFIYAVLKHPEVHARVLQDADALFAKGSIDESDFRNLPAIDGAIMEAMRMYPIAVAQMRTATRDFAFLGHRTRGQE
jgi:cytochrome P450